MGLPNWLTTHPQNERTTSSLPTSQEGRALMFVQFEMVLPRILEEVCAGVTVNNAIKALRPLVNLDEGAFMRWLKKNPSYFAMYKEALEIRTEVWTGKMINHATGQTSEGELPNDVARDKLAVETYWKLIQAQNKKDYGDIKQIEINQQISIIGALDAARTRARTVIDVEAEAITDVDLMSNRQIRQLQEPDEDEDD